MDGGDPERVERVEGGRVTASTARARHRRRSRRLARASLWPAAVLLAVPGCGADDPEEVDQPPFELDVPVERSSLDNGLEVVVIPNHTAPVVTALVAVRAGSAVEEVATNGYSHLFEHMIFQGSEAVPDTVEFHDRLDELGVASNGTTSVDRVTYFFTAASEALEPALDLFAGAIVSPALDPVLLEKEKNVVLGEFDLNESDSDFLHYRAALSGLFGDYSTALDPLGRRDTVVAATPEQLRAMHAAYYVPENALLVLSGDVTHARGRELGERYLGGWPSRVEPVPPAPLGLPGPFDAHRFEVLEAPVTLTSIEVWWRGPTLDDDPRGALAGELLSRISLQTDHSFRGLVGPGLAYSAGLSLRVLRRTSYISVSLGVVPGNEWRALGALRTELERLGAKGDVAEEQLARARASAFRTYLYTSADPASLAFSLADDWALADSGRFFSSVDELYDVGAADLDDFARSYLQRHPRVVVVMSNAETISAQGLDPETLAEVLP